MGTVSDILMTLALGGLAVSGLLFASALLYPCLRNAWRQATNLARAVFCGAGVVACLFGGAKHGKITYPKTDTDVAYLTDAGSYVTNDAVHVAFTRVPTVPDSATFYLDYCALDGTNEQGVATNWVNAKTATFADLEVPFDFAFANATNYNWLAYTDWTPGPAVQTNGVWHAYWGIDKKEGRYFIPVRTCVRDGGSVIATPKSKWDAKDPMELTEAEAYERYAPDTAWMVAAASDEQEYCVTLCSFLSGAAESDRWIDWGDGSRQTVPNSNYSYKHVYAKAGSYVVRVSSFCTAFYPKDGSWGSGKYSNMNVLALRWGDNLTTCDWAFFGAKLKNKWIPRWPKFATDLHNCYYGCSTLEGEIPKYPAGVKNLTGLFADCRKITGRVPDWPDEATTAKECYSQCYALSGPAPADWKNIADARNCFSRCTSLVGPIPAWTDKIVNVQECYASCSSLTGVVPAWGKNITSLASCYYYAQNVSGDVPDWPDTALTSLYGVFCGTKVSGQPPAWPKTVTDTRNCYFACPNLAGTIPDWSGCEALTYVTQTYGDYYTRHYGLTGEVPAWPPNVTKAQSAFRCCAGLTGKIPKWPNSLTDVGYAFYWCEGLTGAWTDDPAELMPTNITSHGDCVTGASDAVRELFYSDWGGTRTKTE